MLRRAMMAGPPKEWLPGTTCSETTMQASTALHTTDIRISAMAARWPAVGVLLFGLVVLYSVGFSNFQRAHNAAHDMRHASGFPCH